MSLKTVTAALLTLSLAALSGPAGAQSGADIKNPVGPDKVVYHINDAEAQAADALRNIQNHLSVNPQAKIVVVAHSRGVDFLFEGAKDKNGNPFRLVIEQLKTQGVQFDVCEITLERRKLRKSTFVPEATYVPSGVAEITRLQQREGYAYLRP
jgi:intracellular sulfur oxidation DsrE/DsrF family protein